MIAHALTLRRSFLQQQELRLELLPRVRHWPTCKRNHGNVSRYRHLLNADRTRRCGSKWRVTSLPTQACGHVQCAPQRQTMLTGGITPCENGWPGGGGDGPAPVCGVGTTSGGTFAPRGCAPWPRSWAAVPPVPLVALLPTPRPPTAGSPVAPQLTAAYPEACAPTGALSPPPFLEHTCRLKEATSLT